MVALNSRWARRWSLVAISSIYINTNLAAANGVVAAILLTQILYKKLDLTMALNVALGG